MPDWRDVSVWERLAAAAEDADGVVAAAAHVQGDAADIVRLRKRFDADLVSAAMELALARRKAVGRLDGAENLWCDAQGVEQASGTLVARWKARRMAEALGPRGAILDCCAGIGGDAIELSRAGLSVTAVDLDARRAWMAARNAGCRSEIADVESINPAGLAIHCDPARRDERSGSRSWNLDEHRPGRAWIERVLRDARAGAVKFSPGVDRRAFGDLAIEWEFIEERGALVQAVAWSGAFARAPRSTRATVLDGAAEHALAGIPDDARGDRLGIAPAATPGAWLCEPTPALERAQLLTEASDGVGAELARGLGLVVAPRPLAVPWFESFEIVESASARTHAVAALIARHGLRARSVRVRGQSVDADAWTRALGCTPSGDAVVFAYRDGHSARVVVTRARLAR